MTALPILPLSDKAARFAAQLPQGELRAAPQLRTLQINLGLFCNLACRHCHVGSSPARNGDHENMSPETGERILTWLQGNPGLTTVDLTGGSPEANVAFRPLVEGATDLGLTVMDRCNPTIIGYEGSAGTSFAWVPAFLAKHHVVVVASLPCYLEENVQKQRGTGSFNASIDGLRALNEVGYGADPNLLLHLVFNPNGTQLPPPQSALTEAYRRELSEKYDLVFNELWTITNMPIQRWRDDLSRKGVLGDYMQLLHDAYNPDTVSGLMCRHQIHIDSQGNLFDCDFNYALDLPAAEFSGVKLWDVSLADLQSRVIAIEDHCYGCTAGCGSSCGGALVG